MENMRDDEIDLVRRRLETLAGGRLAAPLDPVSEKVYRELCARERELLKAETVPDAS